MKWLFSFILLIAVQAQAATTISGGTVLRGGTIVEYSQYAADYVTPPTIASGTLYTYHTTRDYSAIWSDTAGTTHPTNGGRIARIDDKSGNGLHVTQGTATNCPTYLTNAWGGAAKFTAAYLTNHAFTLAAPATMFCRFVQPNILASSGYAVPVMVVGATNGAAFRNFYIDSISAPTARYIEYAGATLSAGYVKDGVPMIDAVTFRTSPNSEVRTNGVQAVIGNAGSPVTQGGLAFGAYLNGSLTNNLILTDVLEYSGTLTTGDKQIIEAWLKRVTTVGYTQIYIDGTSINAGSTDSVFGNFSHQMAESLGPTIGKFNIFNLAIAGQTMTNAQQVFADVSGVYDSRAAKHILLIDGPTNDLALEGVSTNTLQTRLSAYSTAARAAMSGVKIVHSTLFPRPAASTFTQVNMESHNAWLIANAVSGGAADGLVDTTTDHSMGDWGDNTDATYYSDNIHPNDVGQARRIAPWITAMAPFL